MVYGTSNGPQNDIGNYLGPCGTWIFAASYLQPWRSNAGTASQPESGCTEHQPGMCQIRSLRHMGGCQNYGPFSDPYYNTAPNVDGTQKGTIILTTTHVSDQITQVYGHPKPQIVGQSYKVQHTKLCQAVRTASPRSRQAPEALCSRGALYHFVSASA